MTMSWWEKLVESNDARKARELSEFRSSDEFSAMVINAARDVLTEEKDAERAEAEENHRQHKIKIEKATENINAIGEDMEDSIEPFVAVISMGMTSQGIKTKLDWNQAFIRYLHNAGIKGTNDEECVKLWLAHLNDDIIQESLAMDYVANGVSDDEMPSMGYDELFGVNEQDDYDEESDNRWK